MTGIYKITNKLNGKVYIGQSKNLSRRLSQHMDIPNLDCPLYCDMYNDGIENFTFEIIERCDAKLLNDREKYWIEYYDACSNGYNRTTGGSDGTSFSDIARLKLSDSLKRSRAFALHQEAVKQAYDVVSNLLLSDEELVALKNQVDVLSKKILPAKKEQLRMNLQRELNSSRLKNKLLDELLQTPTSPIAKEEYLDARYSNTVRKDVAKAPYIAVCILAKNDTYKFSYPAQNKRWYAEGYIKLSKAERNRLFEKYPVIKIQFDLLTTSRL